jgi:hypothetical protein
MEWIVTLIGVLLVAVVVRDVFHSLFHPVGHGSIAPQVMKAVWRLLRLLPAAGHCAGGADVGFHRRRRLDFRLLGADARRFAYSSELNPAARHNLIDALYLSLVTVATLGFGDVVPTSVSLRLAAPLEALFGFMLVTAAVSWVLEIYPALHRRPVLALQLSTLRRAREAEPGVGIDGVPVDVLTSLSATVVEARNDFTQYGATYYFRDLEADASLAASLEYATQLAAEARASSQPQTRMAGALMITVDSLAELLDQEFLKLGGDTDQVVKAYAADHRHTD